MEDHRSSRMDRRGSGTRFSWSLGELGDPFLTVVWALRLEVSICFRFVFRYLFLSSE